MKKLADEEEARVAKQRKDLGKDGLQQKADVLEKATEQNEVMSAIFCDSAAPKGLTLMRTLKPQIKFTKS